MEWCQSEGSVEQLRVWCLAQGTLAVLRRRTGISPVPELCPCELLELVRHKGSNEERLLFVDSGGLAAKSTTPDISESPSG